MKQIGRNQFWEDDSKVTFGEIVEHYRDDFAMNNRRSRETAEIRCNHLLAYFGKDTRASDIHKSWVKRYRKDRSTRGVSNGTINRETATLGAIFQLAIEDEGLTTIGVPRVKKLEEPPAREGFFEHDVYLRVRDGLSEDLRAVLDFAYRTGWRNGAILGVRWEHVSMDDREIRLSPALSKNKKGWTLYMSESVWKVIRRRWLKRSPLCENVFHRNGKPICSFDKAWQNACEAAGVHGRLFHDCRRTVVRNLVRSGVPQSIAQKITQHKTASTFTRYDINTEDELRQAAEQLEGYMEAKTKKDAPATTKESAS